MRISDCLQFTKYGPVFMGHVVTVNKFGEGVYKAQLFLSNTWLAQYAKFFH